MLIEIKHFNTEVIEAKDPFVVDYWAPWCGPCKMMLATLEKIGTSSPNVKLGKVNVDENADLATKYNISTLPTLVFFENGQEIRRLTGMHPQSVVEKFINGENHHSQ